MSDSNVQTTIVLKREFSRIESFFGPGGGLCVITSLRWDGCIFREDTPSVAAARRIDKANEGLSYLVETGLGSKDAHRQ